MSKKKNRNKASALKQAVKQPAEKPQIKEEEVPDLAGWHMVLFWIKILLIPGYLMNIYVYAKNGIHGTGMYDAAVNAPLLVFLIVSVILHSSRKGVYAFFAFGAVELIYNAIVMIIALRQNVFETAVGNRAIEYFVFSAVILIPTVIYYRKRMHLLKS